MSDPAHIAATLLAAKKAKDALDAATSAHAKVDVVAADLQALTRTPGPRGEAGSPGSNGKDGAPGRDGQPPAHEWQGTKLRFRQPNGKWGKFTDLKGDTGEPGKDRKTIIVRGGGSSIGTPKPGADGIELTGLVAIQGGQLVSLSTQQFAAYVSAALDMNSTYSRRADFVGDSVIYRGEAAPGTPENSPAWRIKKVEFVTDGEGNQDVIETWAGGSDAFAHVWSDRGALAYT